MTLKKKDIIYLKKGQKREKMRIVQKTLIINIHVLIEILY